MEDAQLHSEINLRFGVQYHNPIAPQSPEILVSDNKIRPDTLKVSHPGF